MRAGIDVGGTFTDLVLWDGALLRTAKVPATLGDQSEGVIEVLRSADAVGVEERLPGKATFEVMGGDRLRVLTPGGGGWGPEK